MDESRPHRRIDGKLMSGLFKQSLLLLLLGGFGIGGLTIHVAQREGVPELKWLGLVWGASCLLAWPFAINVYFWRYRCPRCQGKIDWIGSWRGTVYFCRSCQIEWESPPNLNPFVDEHPLTDESIPFYCPQCGCVQETLRPSCASCGWKFSSGRAVSVKPHPGFWWILTGTWLLAWGTWQFLERLTAWPEILWPIVALGVGASLLTQQFRLILGAELQTVVQRSLRVFSDLYLLVTATIAFSACLTDQVPWYYWLAANVAGGILCFEAIDLLRTHRSRGLDADTHVTNSVSPAPPP
jgi:hypothetical protein